MLVMMLENAPASLRGELSRWLNEPKAGVFIGNLSARVRDELWKRITDRDWNGAAIQIWSDHTTPQGYKYRIFGNPERTLVDFEGIALVRLPPKGMVSRKKSELQKDAGGAGGLFGEEA